MGMFRGLLLILTGIVLFAVLFLGTISLTMSLSLNYENVQEEMPILISDLDRGVIGDSSGRFSWIFGEFDILNFNLTQATEEASENMPEHCQEYEDYVFVYEGHVIVLNCSTFEEGNESLLEESFDSFTESVYFKDYGCEFWKCFKETGIPFFLVSKDAKDYWQGRFYFSLLIFLIAIVLTFFLVEQKHNTLVFTGSFMAISVLPLLKIESIVTSASGKIFSPFIRMLFSRVGVVFWTIMIIGIILILSGIALRIISGDFIKKKFSLADIRKMISSEVKGKGKSKKEVKEKD
ncbi:MAG: hypothetical protein WDZ62_00055 [Candidatus Pacearchaeota archaeon]